MSEAPAPLATRLLQRLLPEDRREALLGDLEERAAELAERGAPAATIRALYWREVRHAMTGGALRPRLRADSVAASLAGDLHLAARGLLRQPGFAAATVVTLALAIGATTAVWSVVRGVLLRPLPFPEPERLVLVRGDVEGIESMAAFSGPEVRDLQREASAFESVAAIWGTSGALQGDGEPLHVRYAWTSAETFPMLGVTPIAGRLFAPEDDLPGSEPVLLLGEGLWRARFGADPSIVGRAIRLDDQPRTVIGVVPDTPLPRGADAISLERYDAFMPQTWWTDRNLRWIRVVARLADGRDLASAQAELDSLSKRLVETHAEYGAHGIRFRLATLRDDLVRGVRPALLALLGAVGLVLLVACANVAGLFLARARRREAELALRAALGAGRRRLARQTLTENLLVAVVAGAIGLGLARIAIDVLRRLQPAGLPRLDAVSLDGVVVAGAVGASLLTAILCGVVPAWRAGRLDPRAALGARGTDRPGRHRLRDGLVAAEVTLSLVLLVGAGLLARTFAGLLDQDPGFRATNALVVEAPLAPRTFPSPADRWRHYATLERDLARLPGVRAAGATTRLPLGGGFLTATWGPSDAPADAWGERTAEYASVTPGYFDALGAPLLAGRTFRDADLDREVRVAIVDASLARQVAGDGDPVGRRFRIVENIQTQRPIDAEIVGVVPTLRTESLRRPGGPQIYLPFGRTGDTANGIVVVRSDAAPQALLPAIRGAVDSSGAGRSVRRARLLASYVDDSVADVRFALLLVGMFGVLALLLTAVGLYGVAAYAVSERARELGVRLALGARPAELRTMLLRRSLAVVAVGSVAGFAVAGGLTRFLGSLLWGVGPLDPATFAAIGALLAAVGLAAALAPARRAARIDPIESLRAE